MQKLAGSLRMKHQASTRTEGEVWYFAYGSNMRTAVLKKRGVIPSAGRRVVVPTHVLTFDVFGVPYSEPAMASIVRHRDVVGSENAESRPPAVHGIAYLLSNADFTRLVIAEGAGIAYEVVPVTGHLLEDSDSDEWPREMVLQTLVARFPFRPNAWPSRRYLVGRIPSLSHNSS
ncbi:hypothetical protein MMC30_008641 [Trapelia coarctata]|nr:hypothetical protein [Trapelia coarctata]